MVLGLFVIGMTEWLLIIVAVLLLFGATRIPQLMRGMGKGIREFKDAVNDPGTDSGDSGDSDGGDDGE